MTELKLDSRYATDVEKAISYLKDIGCSEIYIFGSAVTGKANEKSDLDIAVKGIPAEKIFEVYGELMFLLEHQIDLVDLQLQEKFGRILLQSDEILRVA